MQLTNLVDQIAGRFGYARVAPLATTDSASVGDDSSKSMLEAPAPHLLHASDFDFAKVRRPTNWVQSYDENGSLHFAIGRPDWMPVLIAGLMLDVGRQDTQQLLSDAIADQLWLPADAPAHASWAEHNAAVFTAVSRIGQDASDSAVKERGQYDDAQEWQPAMISALPATALGHELRLMWQRTHPKHSAFWLSSSAPHIHLVKAEWMRQAVGAPMAALDNLLVLALQWFAARGLSIDETTRTVGVTGYQPLYWVDDDPGGI